MAEKSISEQIVIEFIDKVAKSEIVDADRLEKLKDVLNSDKPKKADIIKAISKED